MDKLKDIVTMVAGAFAIFSLILAVYQAMQKELASAGLLAAIFLVCTLIVFIPQLEVLKAWGIEARLRQTVGEAVATLDNLKRLSATSAKTPYLMAAWSKLGSPTAKETQLVLDEVDKQLADLKISDDERHEIARPYVQMIGFELYQIYVRTFDRYLSWKKNELLKRYKESQSPESKTAIEDFRDKSEHWRSRAIRSGVSRGLDSAKLEQDLQHASPAAWLEPKEMEIADRFKANLVRLFKNCEAKGGYTPEAADFYDTYHDIPGQDRNIKDMFGVNLSDYRW